MEVTLTEYEENLCFDLDDPDFAPICSRSTSHGVFRGVSFGGGMSINVKKCECFRQIHLHYLAYHVGPFPLAVYDPKQKLDLEMFANHFPSVPQILKQQAFVQVLQ
ncbi:hypothetical protein TKK_0012105 [Trichogramma kaykai]